MHIPRFLPACAAGLVAVLLTSSASAPAETTAPKTTAPATAAPKTAAPKAAAAEAAPARNSITWRAIAAGEAESRKSGRPALYYFTAAWCGPCHLLEEQVFAIPDVAGQIERDFVPIVVQDRARETGKNAPEMLALAERYGLRGFPTLVVSRPNLAANMTLEGWEGPDVAIDFLRSGRKRFLYLERKGGAKK